MVCLLEVLTLGAQYRYSSTLLGSVAVKGVCYAVIRRVTMKVNKIILRIGRIDTLSNTGVRAHLSIAHQVRTRTRSHQVLWFDHSSQSVY